MFSMLTIFKRGTGGGGGRACSALQSENSTDTGKSPVRQTDHLAWTGLKDTTTHHSDPPFFSHTSKFNFFLNFSNIYFLFDTLDSHYNTFFLNLFFLKT